MFRSYIIKNLLYPLYIKKINSKTLVYLKQYEKSQFLKRSELESIQWRNLKKLLNYAYNHNKFYRQKFNHLGIHPNDIQSMDDFRKIPITTKKDIQSNFSLMISDNSNLQTLIKDTTGGSTGKPLTFYYTKDRNEMREAFRIRSNRWSGWDIGSKTITLWGNTTSNITMKQSIYNLITGKGHLFNVTNLTENDLKKIINKIVQYKPSIIIGYASAITYISQYIKENNIHNINPKAIISTAEALSDNNRQLIENTFNCKVFERYGCREIGPIAAECNKHRGLHINMECVLVEVLKENGNPAKPDEIGEIVITDLFNYAMPFIRYKIEDMGIISNDLCDCGRELTLLKSILGRTTDIIKTSSGKLILGPIAIPLICNIPGISQAQIIQKNINHFIIKIVKNNSFTNKSFSLLLKKSKEILGTDVNIEIIFVSYIEKTQSGKYKFVISECNV